MVTIVNYKKCVSQDNKEFFALELRGDLLVVESATGNFYLTANKMSISTSFDELMCRTLIGRTLPGDIKKAPCEEYQYINKETGESFMLNWKYQYFPEEPVQSMQSMPFVQPINPYQGFQQYGNSINFQQYQQEKSNMDILGGFGSMVAAEP